MKMKYHKVVDKEGNDIVFHKNKDDTFEIWTGCPDDRVTLRRTDFKNLIAQMKLCLKD